MFQISLESKSEANIYETVTVQANRPVNKDLNFDEEREHLYVMTDKRVSDVFHE